MNTTKTPVYSIRPHGDAPRHYCQATPTDGVVSGDWYSESGNCVRAAAFDVGLCRLEPALPLLLSPTERMNPHHEPRAATVERFRAAAMRSLDAIKHCRDRMNDNEVETDKRMRNTPPTEWTVRDMNTTINTDMKINHPFIPNPEP